MTPLVSAIMPTRDRRAFIPGALECFQSQDYPNRELIVIDNGEESIFDLVCGLPWVIYRRVQPARIGALRNLACEMARGEYIAHWDSDDWYSPKRLSEQVRLLRQSERPATGYHVLPFADDQRRKAWLYEGSQGYACGTSLMYLRATWRGHRFNEEIPWGEDNAFIEKLAGRLISHAGESIVARIHGSGTSPRDTGGWREIDYTGLARVGYPVAEPEKEQNETDIHEKRGRSGNRHGVLGRSADRRTPGPHRAVGDSCNHDCPGGNRSSCAPSDARGIEATGAGQVA